MPVAFQQWGVTTTHHRSARAHVAADSGGPSPAKATIRDELVSAVKNNSYSVAAIIAVALMLWAWGLGENGDPGFAALCAGVAVATFAVGARARRWWMVPAVSAAWFFGWMLAGELAPDTYTWAVAFFAPGVAVFLALGVAAGRGRNVSPLT